MDEAPRVLVVDDHEFVRKALSRRLEMIGCDVRLAKDGRAAIEDCLEWRPYVVILDRKLPKLNGDDVARLLLEKMDEPPAIIMLTGEPTHFLGPMPGVVKLFTKPVDFQDLWDAMRPYLLKP